MDNVDRTIEILNQLKALGVNQFAVYLMHDDAEATLTAYGQRVIPAFRGWHASPAVGFDLVLVVRQAGEQEIYEAMPVRFIYLNNEWRALVLDADRLQQATGLNCWQ